MFPEKGYIVNYTTRQYFRYNYCNGENMLLMALKNNGWFKSDAYFFVETKIGLQEFTKQGYQDISYLKRPHSA
jgi:hypothetical protein